MIPKLMPSISLTPPDSHRDYTLRCAKVGKPVYVEKPMALNFAECQDMIAACRAASVPLWVAFYRRMLPRFRKIKELIDTGAIGAVRVVSVRLYRPADPKQIDPGNLAWRVLPEQSGGGIFMDMGCHSLDFLDYVLAPSVRYTASPPTALAFYPAEDSVSACFEFESGVSGIGQWFFTSFSRIRPHGNRGHARQKSSFRPSTGNSLRSRRPRVCSASTSPPPPMFNSR